MCCTWARALFARSAGLERFLAAKKTDRPDLGEGYFIDSYRHQWEADLWKLLSHMRRYRDMLAEGDPATGHELTEMPAR